MHVFDIFNKFLKSENLFWVLSFFSLFSIYFSIQLNNISIGLLLLHWLLNGRWAEKWKEIKANFFLQFAVLFYFIHIISILYTENLDRGFFHLGLISPIPIFALIFGTSVTLTKLKAERLFRLFAFAIAGLCLFGVASNFVHYFNNGWFLVFSDFTGLIIGGGHPSVFAIGPCCAVLYLCDQMIRSDKFKEQIAYFALSLIVLMSIFFSSSRMGLLVGGFIYGIGLILFCFKKNKALLLALPILMAAAFFSLKDLASAARFRDIQHDYDVRTLIWSASVEVIQANMLYGVGHGDVHDEQKKVYARKGQMQMLGQFHSHNQYLQTFMGLGIPGILVLAAMFLIPMYRYTKDKHFLGAGITLFFILYCLSDVWFELHKSLTYYAAFTFYLYFQYYAPQRDSSQATEIVTAEPI